MQKNDKIIRIGTGVILAIIMGIMFLAPYYGAPVYSNVSISTTDTFTPCVFSCYWMDQAGLSGYIFGCNVARTWQNETWTPLDGKSAWANVTKTLPCCEAKVEYVW